MQVLRPIIIWRMSAPWFYCTPLALGVTRLDEREARHAFTVLRLEPPAAITLFDGCGRVATATLRQSADASPRRKNAVADVVIDQLTVHPRPAPTLRLVVAACKGSRLDTLIEKGAELGVTRIELAEFERSVVHLEPRHATKLRDTALAAGKQSRNPWLPELETGVPLERALDRTAGCALLVAHPDPTAESLLSVAHALVRSARDATVVIGPEGGLAPSELAQLSSRGARRVQLAPHVLRVETAALAVAACWAAARCDASPDK